MRRRFAAHLGLREPLQPLFAGLAGSDDPCVQIGWLKEQGFAGVFDNGVSARPVAEQSAIGAAVARHGLTFGSIALDPIGWSTPLWTRSDADAQAEQRAVLDHALAAAARVGSDSIGCVTGITPDQSIQAQQQAMADNLARVADVAAAAGVRLCVETVAEQWIPGLLLRRLEEAVAVVDRVDHPAVRLAYDVGHIAMVGDDPVAGIASAGARIGFVQIADAPARADPGAGTVNWRSLFAALDDIGYNGLIEVETLPMTPGVEGEAALLAGLRKIDELK